MGVVWMVDEEFEKYKEFEEECEEFDEEEFQEPVPSNFVKGDIILGCDFDREFYDTITLMLSDKIDISVLKVIKRFFNVVQQYKSRRRVFHVEIDTDGYVKFIEVSKDGLEEPSKEAEKLADIVFSVLDKNFDDKIYQDFDDSEAVESFEVVKMIDKDLKVRIKVYYLETENRQYEAIISVKIPGDSIPEILLDPTTEICGRPLLENWGIWDECRKTGYVEGREILTGWSLKEVQKKAEERVAEIIDKLKRVVNRNTMLQRLKPTDKVYYIEDRKASVAVSYFFDPRLEEPCKASITVSIYLKDDKFPEEFIDPDTKLLGEPLTEKWGHGMFKEKELGVTVSAKDWKELNQKVEEIVNEIVETLMKVKKKNLQST